MPCYNGEAFVEQAVSSVLDQSYPCIELIIVDDGSSDRSMAILELISSQDPRKTITILSQDHGGPSAARNLGLGTATGKYVAFLDADDWWREDCIERLHDAIAACDADIAYCGWQNVGGSARRSSPHIPPKYEHGDPVEAFLLSCPWPINAVMVRRSLFGSLGGFSERRYSAMDYDLWLRALVHTRKMILVPEVMAFYRWHDRGQISARRWGLALDSFAARNEFISHCAEQAGFSHRRARVIAIGLLAKDCWLACKRPVLNLFRVRSDGDRLRR
jgi:glycosyltransferase involved in cell wall biosynthesis